MSQFVHFMIISKILSYTLILFTIIFLGGAQKKNSARLRPPTVHPIG